MLLSIVPLQVQTISSILFKVRCPLPARYIIPWFHLESLIRRNRDVACLTELLIKRNSCICLKRIHTISHNYKATF